MGQLGKKPAIRVAEIAQQEISYWMIVLYLILFILVGFLFLISLAILLNGIAPFNFVQNYSQDIAAVVHLPSTATSYMSSNTSNTAYQIVLSELTLKGLITSLLGFIEYKIYEKLTTLLCFAWKKITGKSRKHIRHKRK